MKSANFFKSKLFLIQIIIALLITIVLIWVTLLSLKNYTHHGEQLEVPDLYGMSIEKAKGKIKSEHLKFSIYDSIYNPRYAPGTVLDQRPLAGAMVKRKRNIFLTINAFQPEQVRFPNLVDNSFRQAYELLVTNGFKIGKLEYIENQFLNLVLFPKYNGDTIFAGSMVDKGATIDLVLGKGQHNGILVPNLIGKTSSQAREKIILSNLNYGQIRFDQSVNNHFDSIQAKVWKQSPSSASNQKILLGSEIDVWLTQDSIKLQQADSILQKSLSNLLY
ncbi:PASTA domain-containing protein [Labilibaculum sp.]|uniref:PASTA domain-containing protein n=1 Tax=Labilibaculum sp. TaxID=2060723 RepID=UPI003565915E